MIRTFLIAALALCATPGFARADDDDHDRKRSRHWRVPPGWYRGNAPWKQYYQQPHDPPRAWQWEYRDPRFAPRVPYAPYGPYGRFYFRWDDDDDDWEDRWEDYKERLEDERERQKEAYEKWREREEEAYKRWFERQEDAHKRWRERYR
jgi:hypothetical protein